MAFTDSEISYLSENRARIDDTTAALALTKKSALTDHKVLRDAFGDYSRAVTELVVASRSAGEKFPTWWLTDSDAAQQATSAIVSELRASKIKQAGARLVHDVTCSIGTEAPAVYAHEMQWLGSDLDHARLRMARYNLGQDAWLVRADATVPVSQADVIVADPARRVGGRRITDPAKLMPPLPELVQAYQGRELAVKCAPGIDYSEWEGLVSISSVGGAVKEACLYTPGLGTGLRREAIVCDTEGVVERVTDLDPDDVDVRAPGRYIIEPDGAVIRAGLVRGWAARHGLWMLDSHIAFLSGEAIPEGSSGFPFIETVPLKKLKQALAAYDAGAIEILVRGVDVDPDQLRKKMKLKGKRSMGVIIARIGSTATAFLCGARERSGERYSQLSD
ncbi:THUMP-like domain-containing protein [Corynebacterium sp. S7]